MNTDKYNRIRDLVRRWYDGTTTPRQDAELTRFFDETDVAGLPDDLAGEADVFRTLGQLSGTCPDRELLAEIDEAVKDEQQDGVHPGRIGRLALAVAAAASLALVLFTGIRFDGDDKMVGAVSERLAVVDTVVRPVNPDVPVVEEQPKDVVEDDAVEQRAVEKSRPRVRKTPVKVADDQSYDEITDPEEAARVLEQIQRQYSDVMALSAKAISRTDRALDNTNAIIRDALQNI